MPEATNVQMQAFADQRIRPWAEAARALYLAAKDHKASIDDVYARATGSTIWNDNRTDGPAKLLMAGGSANPDDVEAFNSFITALITFFETTAASDWAVVRDACVSVP